MHEERGRGGQGGWTVMEVLIVLLLLAALAAIALPNLHAARLRNDEAAAVRTLREVVAVQEMFRRAGIVDADHDGPGEYAFLGELNGESNPRSFVPVSGAAVPAPLPQFRHRILEEGEAEICGYRFRVWLPGPGGKAVGEGSEGGGGEPDPGLAAKAWCIYAWPVRLKGSLTPATGTRTFFANQAGEVLWTEGSYEARPPGENALPRRPDPGAAFLAPGPLGSITGAPAMGTLGRDGNLWRPLE